MTYLICAFEIFRTENPEQAEEARKELMNKGIYARAISDEEIKA